jgi:hypothetical protein
MVSRWSTSQSRIVRACRPRAAVALGPRRVHAPRRPRHDRAGAERAVPARRRARRRSDQPAARPVAAGRDPAGAAPRPRLRRTRREGRAGRAHGDERGAAPTADRGRPAAAATALGLGDEPAVDDDRTFADMREPARPARTDTVVTLRSGGGASGPRRSTSTRCARRWTATRAWSSTPFPAVPVHCASSCCPRAPTSTGSGGRRPPPRSARSSTTSATSSATPGTAPPPSPPAPTM